MNNEKIRRNKKRIFFTFEESKKQNDNDKIIIPKFESQDIIYFFTI